MAKSYETRIASLEARVESLEKKRPGRKAMPILVSEEGVCGVDPDGPSLTCPHASLYRRNKGCRGEACVLLSQKYYADRRQNNGD